MKERVYRLCLSLLAAALLRRLLSPLLRNALPPLGTEELFSAVGRFISRQEALLVR